MSQKNDRGRPVTPVDNPLYEARLHGLHQGDEIIFHEDHILHVHDTHRQELVLGMDVGDLRNGLGRSGNKSGVNSTAKGVPTS